MTSNAEVQKTKNTLGAPVDQDGQNGLTSEPDAIMSQSTQNEYLDTSDQNSVSKIMCDVVTPLVIRKTEDASIVSETELASGKTISSSTTDPRPTTAALVKPTSEDSRLDEDQNVDTVPPTTDSTNHSSSPSGITICPVVETVTSDHVSTQTDSKLVESRPSVEASVQAGSATNESAGLEEPQITFDEVPLFRNRFSENHNSQCPPLVNWNIVCGIHKESWCSHTIKKNRYTLSCMLLYMIMTTFLTRVFHLDSEFSCLSTCSVYDGILYFNAISLLVSGISLAIQLTLDTYGIHNRSALLFNIVMSTIQMMLYLVTFVRIYHCRGSLFDYLFPALTFVMCIGYACLGTITLPKILGCSNVY